MRTLPCVQTRLSVALCGGPEQTGGTRAAPRKPTRANPTPALTKAPANPVTMATPATARMTFQDRIVKVRIFF